MPDGLRARLLGAWRLLDVVEEPLDAQPARAYSPARAALAYRFTPALAAAGDMPERTNGE
jgi:hypothetical protein